jgi:hypothetical protein
MTSPWHRLPVLAPADGLVVWVRRWLLGAPFLATWDLAAQTFTAANGLVMPWYDVWRWKHQTEPPP